MLVETSRFFLHGWIDTHYLAPGFLFKYAGFSWVAPWPGHGLYWHFAILLLLSLMVTLGWFYRTAIIGLFFGFAYVFLLDQAQYLNHYYLLLLVALILCFVPADRAYVLRAGTLSVRSQVPRWSVWALRAQFELMLIYAGLVKINEDWLAGQPLRIWFEEQAATFGVWLMTPGIEVLAAYGVVLLHLVGAPLLLWRRTRLAVFVVYVAFHLANSLLFHIGVFPWITLAGTLMFFDPGWPREILARLGFSSTSRAAAPEHPERNSLPAFLVLLFVIQILVPLRALFYPGKAAWTHEGYDFSWRMKLDDKLATARFTITDPASARRWEVDPADHLGSRQVMMMAVNPDMIVQFAHHLEALWKRREGLHDLEVRAQVMCALNGRPPVLLIDPRRDLTRVTRSWRSYDWILPAPGSAIQ